MKEVMTKNELEKKIKNHIEEIRDNLYQLYNLGFITPVQNEKLQDLVRSCGWEIVWEIDTKREAF